MPGQILILDKSIECLFSPKLEYRFKGKTSNSKLRIKSEERENNSLTGIQLNGKLEKFRNQQIVQESEFTSLQSINKKSWPIRL